MARINLGRHKIAMKKISSRKDLQVGFSKRRCSLFKKASELCILTGAKVSFIVFSPSGKPFSFGHPSVSAILSRFFNGRRLSDSDDQGPSGDAKSSLYQQHNELRNRLEAEKKHSEELKVHLLNFREKIAEELILRKAFNSTN